MNLTPKRALFAEDHPAYRGRVQAMLLGWGLEVDVAVDGREALRLIEAGTAYDLLVTDLEMPHHTGFEVIDAWLRAGGRAGRVLMVTGEADALDVRRRCAEGGICLIHKVAIATGLERAVRAALRDPEGRTE